MQKRAKDDDQFEDICILEANEIGSIWQVCFIANSFTFPIYAYFDKEYGISRMEFVVLYVTAHHENTMAWEVCRITGLPKNNISRGTQKLLQKGLITRRTDPDDARRSFLNLTDSGYALFRKLLKAYSNRANYFLELLDEDDRANLEEIALRLSRRLASKDIPISGD